MVLHEITTLGVTIGVDITQNPQNQEFDFTFTPQYNNANPKIEADTKLVKITTDTLLDDNWSPARNVITQQDSVRRLNNKYLFSVSMTRSSLFEAWAVPVDFYVLLDGRERYLRRLLIFDLYRHQLLLGNAPLIEFHGFGELVGDVEATRYVVAHASTSCLLYTSPSPRDS